MQYINPYSLLGFTNQDLRQIDAKAILREKKNLLNEIELSNTLTINYKGIEITKSDCIRTIDELDNKDKREYHFFIFQHSYLNDFLTKGDISFFEQYRIESIYSSIPFINFISPYFTFQYGKLLNESFNQGNIKNTAKILSVKPISNQEHLESCYRTTYSVLRNQVKEIDNINDEIKHLKGNFDEKGLDNLPKQSLRIINVPLLNILPFYFQNVRNQIAESINSLSTIVFNKPHNRISPAYELMQIAKSIKTDGLIEQTITKDYYLVEGQYNDKINESKLEKEQPGIAKYHLIINEIIDKIKQVENKTITASQVDLWVNSRISIQELNFLPQSALKVKNETALYLKELSITVWNSLTDINLAVKIISRALEIKVDENTKANLSKTKVELNSLKLKIQLRNSQSSTSRSPKQINGAGIMITVVAVVIFYAICNSPSSTNSPSGSGYSNSNNTNSTPPNIDSVVATADSSSLSTKPIATQITDSSAISIDITTINKNLTESLPVFLHVSMANGNIPNCHNFESEYDDTLDNELIISLGLTDAAVKIINYETNACIRYVFINSNTSYTVRHIPQGKYYLKIAYGQDWLVKKGDSNCKGRFASHSYYKKGEEILDFNLISTYSGYRIPSFSLKLGTYSSNENSNNFNTNNISELEFENN